MGWECEQMTDCNSTNMLYVVVWDQFVRKLVKGFENFCKDDTKNP